MVRVNRHQLSDQNLDQLHLQLARTLSRLDNIKTGIFLNELLGPEERLTFAKRLASVILLLEDFSQYKTAKLLKLSPSTVEKVARKIAAGQYDGLIKILGKDKKEYFTILESLDSILHLGGLLPHYNGLDRYRTQ